MLTSVCLFVLFLGWTKTLGDGLACSTGVFRVSQIDSSPCWFQKSGKVGGGDVEGRKVFFLPLPISRYSSFSLTPTWMLFRLSPSLFQDGSHLINKMHSTKYDFRRWDKRQTIWIKKILNEETSIVNIQAWLLCEISRFYLFSLCSIPPEYAHIAIRSPSKRSSWSFGIGAPGSWNCAPKF